LIESYSETLKKDNNIKNAKRKCTKLADKYYEQKSVLGFDIYRYSKYGKFEQMLIPYTLNEIYNTTCDNCTKHEQIFF
jgi:hypothetical protein